MRAESGVSAGEIGVSAGEVGQSLVFIDTAGEIVIQIEGAAAAAHGEEEAAPLLVELVDGGGFGPEAFAGGGRECGGEVDFFCVEGLEAAEADHPFVVAVDFIFKIVDEAFVLLELSGFFRDKFYVCQLFAEAGDEEAARQLFLGVEGGGEARFFVDGGEPFQETAAGEVFGGQVVEDGVGDGMVVPQ